MISVLRRLFLAFAALAGLLVAGAAVAQAQPAAPPVPVPSAYVLGPDDGIQVSVYGSPELSVTTRIKADGTIIMPLIGVVKADGQTNISLAKVISDKLTSAGYLKNPFVNVEIAGYVSKTVNVAGKVSSPGIVPLDRPYRALDILLKSGWVQESGANYIYLRRQGAPERKLEVEKLVRGEADQDPLMQPGDTLYVPEADTFFIYGQINSPGIKPILPNMTIRQALAMAGGVTPTGKSDKVGLIRGNAKEVSVEVTQPVQKGDVIVVKERLF